MNRYRTPLFPISLYHSCISDNNKIKELVYPLIEKYNQRHTNPPEGWFTNKIQTSFDDEEVKKIMMDTDNKIGKELNRQYSDVIRTFFDISFEVQINDMWYNVYENGEYQEAHTHFGTYNNPNHYACVHFLNFDPKVHAPLCVLDPLRHLRISSFEYFNNTEYKDDHNFLNVKEGDLLMFPAYLEHEVRPSPPTPGNPRITISFNIKVVDAGEHLLKDDK